MNMAKDKNKEKSPKTTMDKKSKTQLSKKRKNCDKKKSPEEGNRRYGYFSTTSLVSMSESVGLLGINDEAFKNLSEDVSYRLRNIAHNCSKLIKQSRRKQLTCADVNQVFSMCDVPPVYGHQDNEDYCKFTYVKEADLFVTEDTMVDLAAYALSEISVRQKSPISVAGSWQASDDIDNRIETKIKTEDVKTIEDVQLSHASKNMKLNHVSNTHLGSSVKMEECVQRKVDNHKILTSEAAENETNIPPNIIKYYGLTCNTILGHSDLKIVFQDLSQNQKILPVVPYLLNFITITLNKLNSVRQIYRLLQTVEALTENTQIDFTPYRATNRVVTGVLLIIAGDKKPANVSYNYDLRRYAARVLAKVFNRWCTRDEQCSTIIKKMGELVQDVKVSSKVHYGAIVLLTALGADALNHLWNFIHQYLRCLQVVKKGFRKNKKVVRDVGMLEDAIMSAAEVLYRQPEYQSIEGRVSIPALDKCLYEYFGDSICIARRCFLDDPRFIVEYYKLNSDAVKQENKACEHVLKRPSVKYQSTRYNPEARRPSIDTVFQLTTVRKKRYPRILFKSVKVVSVPDVKLKRKRLDSRYSQFIAGRESEGHVAVVGKFWRKSKFDRIKNIHLRGSTIFCSL